MCVCSPWGTLSETPWVTRASGTKFDLHLRICLLVTRPHAHTSYRFNKVKAIFKSQVQKVITSVQTDQINRTHFPNFHISCILLFSHAGSQRKLPTADWMTWATTSWSTNVRWRLPWLPAERSRSNPLANTTPHPPSLRHGFDFSEPGRSRNWELLATRSNGKTCQELLDLGFDKQIMHIFKMFKYCLYTMYCTLRVCIHMPTRGISLQHQTYSIYQAITCFSFLSLSLSTHFAPVTCRHICLPKQFQKGARIDSIVSKVGYPYPVLSSVTFFGVCSWHWSGILIMSAVSLSTHTDFASAFPFRIIGREKKLGHLVNTNPSKRRNHKKII